MSAQTALRSRRLALGLSQWQAAERAGFKQQHYSQIERGVRPMTTRMIEQLAPALECHPADLLTMPDNVVMAQRDKRDAELLELFRQLRIQKRDALITVARALVECEPWGHPRETAEEEQRSA